MHWRTLEGRQCRNGLDERHGSAFKAESEMDILLITSDLKMRIYLRVFRAQ